MNDKKDIKNDNLKHNKIMYQKREIYGVPSKLFIGTSLLVFAVWVTAGYIPGLFFFLILIPPLIIIHKKDDKGLSLIYDKIKRPVFYSAGAVDHQAFKQVKRFNSRFDVRFLNHQ
ncbi:MAG: hypothetical protein CMD81_08090 [Gammaproteobacteria bacterium]|nr:hypothetical protein [Gammaproteobacteria bacterium]MBK82271.1 hypothetical protein [Gammaproteobacteria bacterium]MBK83776.1 hypothetical protein [Gammaproteobacteria bacterium]HCV05149.1 hypothetical protein [Pseudoalteromonas sp.]|tara:strand:- start:16909 stop:17253 length:345 start_codon:yes stop_codon:yes gene_type:complete